MEATILLQQKQLLEKCLSQNENTERLIARQMKLEEDREARERRRDKKEEESLSNRKRYQTSIIQGKSWRQTRSTYFESRRLDGCFKP